MNRTPTIVIAGNHNGVGKTSLSVAIIAALRCIDISIKISPTPSMPYHSDSFQHTFTNTTPTHTYDRRRGLVIQPFKVGPEVGDALQLGIAAERDCVLIDGWVLDHEKIVSSFSRHTQGCDLAVVEGTHDLFDGIDGNSEQGSTSQIAKVLGAPVVLVFNFWTLTASAAVKGFLQYDEQLQLSGVILNSVVESQQLQQLRANFYRSGVGLDLVGNVPKMSTPVLPPAFECGAFCVPGSEVPEYIEVLADLAEQHMDLDRIVSIAATSRFISRGVVPRPVSRYEGDIVFPLSLFLSFYRVYKTNKSESPPPFTQTQVTCPPSCITGRRVLPPPGREPPHVTGMRRRPGLLLPPSRPPPQ